MELKYKFDLLVKNLISRKASQKPRANTAQNSNLETNIPEKYTKLKLQIFH